MNGVDECSERINLTEVNIEVNKKECYCCCCCVRLVVSPALKGKVFIHYDYKYRRRFTCQGAPLG